MNVFLKVKIKSLAAEAKIIRKEELTAKRRRRDELRYSLHEHRIHAVRPECRTSHLAYGFLRGRAYKTMEKKCYTKPDWDRVERLVLKYGEDKPQNLKQHFSEWKQTE